MPELNAVLAKPEDFGFQFFLDVVHKDKRPSTPVPLIRLQDITKFEAAFPGVILQTENGQSIKVNAQRISRNAWFAGDKDEKSLKVRLVKWLLGIEQSTSQVIQKYLVEIDGEVMEFDSKEEAVAAMKELATA